MNSSARMSCGNVPVTSSCVPEPLKVSVRVWFPASVHVYTQVNVASFPLLDSTLSMAQSVPSMSELRVTEPLAGAEALPLTMIV